MTSPVVVAGGGSGGSLGSGDTPVGAIWGRWACGLPQGRIMGVGAHLVIGSGLGGAGWSTRLLGLMVIVGAEAWGCGPGAREPCLWGPCPCVHVCRVYVSICPCPWAPSGGGCSAALSHQVAVQSRTVSRPAGAAAAQRVRAYTALTVRAEHTVRACARTQNIVRTRPGGGGTRGQTGGAWACSGM